MDLDTVVLSSFWEKFMFVFRVPFYLFHLSFHLSQHIHYVLGHCDNQTKRY